MPKWKAKKWKLSKKIWSTIIQLKIGHGYFKSYLIRLSDYFNDNCLSCETRENPEHLLMHCKKYQEIRKELKEKEGIEDWNLKVLFETEKGRN
jgi:hypothetical protein